MSDTTKCIFKKKKSPEDLLGVKHWRLVLTGLALREQQVGWGGASPLRSTSLSALADEGLWDILIKDIPKEVTSYTFSMDILRPGVSYDFRVIAVNDYGFGTPSSPSQSVPGTGLWGEGWGAPLGRGWAVGKEARQESIGSTGMGTKMHCPLNAPKQ